MDAVNPFSARMFSIPDSSNAVSLMCNVLRFVRFLRLENLAPPIARSVEVQELQALEARQVDKPVICDRRTRRDKSR